METPCCFNCVSDGLVSASDLDDVFAHFLQSPGWRELETRTSRRLCDQWTFEGDRTTPPPPHLRFSHVLVQKLLDRLQHEHNITVAELIPLSCFLCLYEDGDDACPSHVHDCRQLTLSMGDERTLTVEGRPFLMRHGDVVVLDGERHAVPLQHGRNCQPRVSVNIFYTVACDLASREVSVNHKHGSSYQKHYARVGKGGEKGQYGRRASRERSTHSSEGTGIHSICAGGDGSSGGIHDASGNASSGARQRIAGVTESQDAHVEGDNSSRRRNRWQRGRR